MNELRHCPCGGEPELLIQGGFGLPVIAEIVCKRCKASIEVECIGEEQAIQEVVSAWNRANERTKPFAVMISGKMTSKKEKEEREQAIEDMRTGKKKYLFATYSLAREGLDIPGLERLFMVTPQKDYAVITQSIGRIARVSENKDNPVVYDFVDKSVISSRAIKSGVVFTKRMTAIL